MIDMLRYGLEDEGIRIDMPRSAFDKAVSGAEHFGQIIDHPLAKQFVEAEEKDGGASLLLNTARLGVLKDRWIQNDRARAMTYVATMAALYTDADQFDPDIYFVNMSIHPIGDSAQYGMEAGINRWIGATSDVEADVTRAMGRTALNLNRVTRHDVKDTVFARIDSATGVTLEANAAIGSSLDTDGAEYDPDLTVMALGAHNVTDRQTQLILLSGVIALAKS
jgi:hypothetical protein